MISQLAIPNNPATAATSKSGIGPSAKQRAPAEHALQYLFCTIVAFSIVFFIEILLPTFIACYVHFLLTIYIPLIFLDKRLLYF